MPGSRPHTTGDNSSGNCVEIIDTGAAIVQRDASDRQLVYSYNEWDEFVAGIKLGVFDRE
jgi:galactose mutarotase-like enzyme